MTRFLRFCCLACLIGATVRADDPMPRFLDAAQAFALAKGGGWDVVLERRQDQPTATWLVEHHRDFSHSTPPRR